MQVTQVVHMCLVATGLLSPLASSRMVCLSRQTSSAVLANWHRRVNCHVLVCPTDTAAPRELPWAPEARSSQSGGVSSLKSDTFQTLAVPGDAAHPPLEEGDNGFGWVQTPQCLALRVSWLPATCRREGKAQEVSPHSRRQVQSLSTKAFLSTILHPWSASSGSWGGKALA